MPRPVRTLSETLIRLGIQSSGDILTGIERASQRANRRTTTLADSLQGPESETLLVPKSGKATKEPR